MSIGYIPGDKTLFSHIRKVRPGEIVTREIDGTVSRAYYSVENNEFDGLTEEEAMSQNVAIHLASKKRVAINLSGGMDSSLLLHEMSALGHEMHTYTTRFDTTDNLLNEDATLAEKLSQEYGTDHTEFLITSRIYKNNLIKACEIVEEPNYNISLATYLEVAKNEGINGDNNRVILSGDGGDELFGGYSTYRQNLRYIRLINRLTPSIFNSYKYLRDKSYWNYNDPLERWLRSRYFFFGIQDRKKCCTALLERKIPRVIGICEKKILCVT